MFSLFIFETFSWGSKSHTSISNQTFEILKNDKKEVYNFYMNTNSKYISTFLTGTVDPDTVETGAGTHYYVYPGTGTINIGQYYPNAERHSSDESARTRLDEHYDSALDYYKDGDLKNAFLHLGRACHYLQDIGTTPHAAGIQYPTDESTNYHKLFETYANKVIPTTASLHVKTSSYYGKLNKLTFGIYLNKLCASAASYADKVTTESEDKWMEAIKATVPLCEEYTAAFLVKFYNDVN